jgi:hypothetical protein
MLQIVLGMESGAVAADFEIPQLAGAKPEKS